MGQKADREYPKKYQKVEEKMHPLAFVYKYLFIGFQLNGL